MLSAISAMTAEEVTVTFLNNNKLLYYEADKTYRLLANHPVADDSVCLGYGHILMK